MPDAKVDPTPALLERLSQRIRMLGTRHAAALFTTLVFAGITCPVIAQSTPIDTEHSKITIAVYKSGLFSGFAHDHQIAAPLSSGTLDPTARIVELRFDARKMKVLDPGVSDSDRVQVQKTMLSDEVLDAQRFPDITFTSRRVTDSGAEAYVVEGELMLHGVSRHVTVPVALKDDRYIGSVKLKQTDFGIKPVKIFGGTVKVKDVIQIAFEIVPATHNASR